jgi:hypothetical protein
LLSPLLRSKLTGRDSITRRDFSIFTDRYIFDPSLNFPNI